jgi:cyclopropane-fatty-acyl-phospholipid synthase
MVEVDDLDSALNMIDTFKPPPLSVRQRLRLASALLRACGLTLPPRRPATELRLRGERHTLARDRRAVRHHYDVGNDFFALFLDESMTYSCGCFSRGAATLEEAQETKLELVCTKLGLRPGERVLDVGCGWGSFAIHAAERHGAHVLGITLAEHQAELARERVRAAGVEDRVEIRLADYREVPPGVPFDAIASIGMVEHVGAERIDEYAARLHALLRPGGRLLNHGIAKLKDLDTPDEGPFSERFVFPDGVPLPLSRVELALERAGFVTRHVEGFQADYAQTLRHWIERYERRYDDAIAIAGIERARIWRLYLRAARLGFETGWASIYQVLADRP